MVLTIAIVNHESLPTIDISDIHIAQGDLKSLSRADYKALRFGLEDYGYCEPIVVWKGPDGINWCADGAQRLTVLKAMRSDNWVIPALPVTMLKASSKADMLRKLALLAGAYGKATQESVSDFAIANDIDWDFIEKYTSIADFKSITDEQIQAEAEKDAENAETVCPSCGFCF